MDSAFAFTDLTISQDGQVVQKLPKAVDLSHHLTLLARSRQANALKGLYQYAGVPGMIALAGGLPSPEYFPFENLSAEVQAKDAFSTVPPGEKTNEDKGFLSWLFSKSAKKPANQTIFVPKYDATPDPSKVTLEHLLQYSGAQGHPALQAFIKEFVQKVYQPAYADWDTLLDVGSTDGWSKVVSLLLERDDPILVEEWTYTGATNAYLPLNSPQIAIKIDGDGIVPSDMERILSTWNPDEHGGRSRPRLLYTVPVGQNPTGSLLSTDRKKAIYEICVKYDVIICEDDPYYFLYADPWVPRRGKKAAAAARATRLADNDKGQKEFLKALPPSFLKFDYQGRVIRLETFSKTIAPGSRLGFFVASEQLCERLLRASEASTQAPCGFGQALVTQLLTQQWKFDGYIRWLRGIKATYAMRRDWMCDLFEEVFHLEFDRNMNFAGGIKGVTAYAKPSSSVQVLDEKRGHKDKALISFVPPSAGMFVWLQVHIGNHPDIAEMRARGEENPEQKLMEKLWKELAENKVLVCPGEFFDGQKGKPHGGSESSGFFRLSFSIATEQQMEVAIKTMYKVMTSFFRVK